jgi:hypothetical protein
MPRSDRNAVNVSGETKTKVEQIASQEERSVAQMVRILLNEAIAAREDTQEASLRDVLKLIRTFDVPTLAKVIEESVRLILQRSSTPETTAVATFMRGWDMEKLVQASGIPIERLEEIRNGGHITASEATVLSGLA